MHPSMQTTHGLAYEVTVFLLMLFLLAVLYLALKKKEERRAAAEAAQREAIATNARAIAESTRDTAESIRITTTLEAMREHLERFPTDMLPREDESVEDFLHRLRMADTPEHSE